MTQASNPVEAENTAPAEAIVVPAELAPLVRKLKLQLYAESIWLRGSGSDGARKGDWDLLVALPDDGHPDHHDPILGWILQQEAGVPATIQTTTISALDATMGGGERHPSFGKALRLL